MRNTTDHVWLNQLNCLLQEPDYITSPRGMKVYERSPWNATFRMWDCVLTVPERKLNYKFMAAEAYWILTGDDRVATIGPYNPHIKNFSDNGVTFFGAYGPKIMDQMPYVVNAFKKDLQTRQAVITIWRESPPETKDVPCTVTLAFQLRNGALNCHVFMRSSDIWLGLPYDVFNFSMVSHYLLGKLYQEDIVSKNVNVGNLYFTTASSHLYETNFEAAMPIALNHGIVSQVDGFCYTPPELQYHPKLLLQTLKALRNSNPGDEIRWWEKAKWPNA